MRATSGSRDAAVKKPVQNGGDHGLKAFCEVGARGVAGGSGTAGGGGAGGGAAATALGAGCAARGRGGGRFCGTPRRFRLLQAASSP